MMWIIQNTSHSRQVLVLAPASSPVAAFRMKVERSLSANSTRQAGRAKSRVSSVGFSTRVTEGDRCRAVEGRRRQGLGPLGVDDHRRGAERIDQLDPLGGRRGEDPLVLQRPQFDLRHGRADRLGHLSQRQHLGRRRARLDLGQDVTARDLVMVDHSHDGAADRPQQELMPRTRPNHL
jgi:hypothetical protein